MRGLELKTRGKMGKMYLRGIYLGGGRMMKFREAEEASKEVGKIQRGRTSDMRRRWGIRKGADVIIYVF
jgi:hypothetical protein